MIYQHLNQYSVAKGAFGPKVLQSNIVISLATNKNKYKVEENSPVEQSLAVGLWATIPGALVDETNTQAATAVLNTAYLVIRRKSQETYQKISFEQIRAANAQGRPYYLYMDGPINLSESVIIVPNNAAIVANEVIELQVDYIEITIR